METYCSLKNLIFETNKINSYYINLNYDYYFISKVIKALGFCSYSLVNGPKIRSCYFHTPFQHTVSQKHAIALSIPVSN